MPKVRDVCRHVRSKNAGPYWVTFDFFFDGRENFGKYHSCEALGPELFSQLFGTDPALVKRIPVEDLNMVKISFPRGTPQGGIEERDMHSGQQYVRVLGVELGR